MRILEKFHTDLKFDENTSSLMDDNMDQVRSENFPEFSMSWMCIINPFDKETRHDFYILKQSICT